MKKWNWTRLYKTKEAQIRAFEKMKKKIPKDKSSAEIGSAIHDEIQELVKKAILEER